MSMPAPFSIPYTHFDNVYLEALRYGFAVVINNPIRSTLRSFVYIAIQRSHWENLLIMIAWKLVFAKMKYLSRIFEVFSKSPIRILATSLST